MAPQKRVNSSLLTELMRPTNSDAPPNPAASPGSIAASDSGSKEQNNSSVAGNLFLTTVYRKPPAKRTQQYSFGNCGASSPSKSHGS